MNVTEKSSITTSEPPPFSHNHKMTNKLLPAFILSPHLPNILSQSGFCLNKWLPNAAMNLAVTLQEIAFLPQTPILDLLPPGEGRVFSSLVITAPIAEELLFRGVIQELLLKRAPAALLRKISAEAASWVESDFYVRIGRVALSTLLFSLAHSHLEDCAMSNRPLGVIGFGAFTGAHVEWAPKNGLSKTIALHMFANVFAYALARTVGLSADPIFKYIDQQS